MFKSAYFSFFYDMDDYDRSSPYLEVPYCTKCGVLVADEALHEVWHKDQQ
jgi:hypothetical protein